MILLNVNRSVYFKGLICYLYYGCHRSGQTPLLEIIRLDLIGLWICPCLMVECLHVMSLLSLESTILADSLFIENIMAIHMFVIVFILVKSWYVFSISIDAFMFIHYIFTCSHDHWLLRSMRLNNI